MQIIPYILTQITVVLLPAGGYIDGLTGTCGMYGGAYNYETNIMYICTEVEEEIKEHVVYHESAHYVWFKLLTESQRKKYTTEWENSEFLLTEYSETSQVEGFAEDFAICIVHNCNEPSKRLAIVRKIIKQLKKDAAKVQNKTK